MFLQPISPSRTEEIRVSSDSLASINSHRLDPLFTIELSHLTGLSKFSESDLFDFDFGQNKIAEGGGGGGGAP